MDSPRGYLTASKAARRLHELYLTMVEAAHLELTGQTMMDLQPDVLGDEAPEHGEESVAESGKLQRCRRDDLAAAVGQQLAVS